MINEKNELWVASENGLYFYDRITDHFEVKHPNYVRSLFQYEGKVYFSTIGRILRREKSGNVEMVRGLSDVKEEDLGYLDIQQTDPYGQIHRFGSSLLLRAPSEFLMVED